MTLVEVITVSGGVTTIIGAFLALFGYSIKRTIRAETTDLREKSIIHTEELKNIGETLIRVEMQTTKTNGRVNKLEVNCAAKHGVK